MNRRTALKAIGTVAALALPIGAMAQQICNCFMCVRERSGKVEYRDGMALTAAKPGETVEVDWVTRTDDGEGEWVYAEWIGDELHFGCKAICPVWLREPYADVVLVRGGWWGPNWQIYGPGRIVHEHRHSNWHLAHCDVYPVGEPRA